MQTILILDKIKILFQGWYPSSGNLVMISK